MSSDSTIQEPRSHDRIVTIDCDALYPDEIEKVKLLLGQSRYTFRVREVVTSQDSVGGYLSFLRLQTRLSVAFSLSLFRRQRGGVDAIVKAVDETLSESAHEENREAKVLYGPTGEIVVSIQESTRRRSKKKAWSLERWIAVSGLVLTAVAVVVAVLTLFASREARQWLHLEKKEASKVEIQAAPQNVLPNPVEPTRPESSLLPNGAARPTQKMTANVKGNSNVAGNSNITANSNQTAQSAVAPNGIAITGGTVTNPTVNNFGPPPLPTPTVTICLTHPTPQQTVLMFKTDVEIMEAWYALFFDGPVGDGSVEMTSASFGYTHQRADKLVHPENSFVFKNTSINFGPPRWLPNTLIRVTVPSKDPVNLVKLLSGSGENGRDEKFIFQCD
jgi:hypothetical protein